MLKNKRYFFEVVALTLFFTLFLYGCKKVTVPSVTGMTQAEALQELTSSGLKVGDVTEEASSTVAVGDIISQYPTAGSSAIRGSTVDLVVSLGPLNIEGSWGGYWWYQGVKGDVYITWDYHEGQFTAEIPSVNVIYKGTYTIDDTANPSTIDVYITESNTAAVVVGKTYRGYYKITSTELYLSQLFETRPVWSSSVLDPDTGIVFVADQI